MMFPRTIVVVTVLFAWGAGLEVTRGQAPATGPNSSSQEPSSAQESSSDANRSGLTAADRGSFEASTSTEGMIGRSAEDVSRMLRELRGTKRQQRSVDMTVENLNERRSSRNRRRSQRNPPPAVHVHFRPSFDLHQRPAAQVASGMQVRISRLLEQRAAGTVRIEVADRTATLTGIVKSEYEQKLLERMVRIEPGISTVKNLVVVEGPALAPEP